MISLLDFLFYTVIVKRWQHWVHSVVKLLWTFAISYFSWIKERISFLKDGTFTSLPLLVRSLEYFYNVCLDCSLLSHTETINTYVAVRVIKNWKPRLADWMRSKYLTAWIDPREGIISELLKILSYWFQMFLYV